MSNFFTEVIQKDPRYKSKERISDLELLEPVLRGLVTKIIADAQSMGVELGVFETFRSKQRQRQLYEEGHTKLKTVGVHHYGLACDLVRRYKGKFNWELDHSVVGQLALKYRLVWGGTWKDFYDAYHIQRIAAPRQKELFASSFYPPKNYDALRDAIQFV
jgi:hypothetical protein